MFVSDLTIPYTMSDIPSSNPWNKNKVQYPKYPMGIIKRAN